MGRSQRLIAAVAILSIAIVVAYLTLGERVTRASLSHSVASKAGLSFFGSCRTAAGGGSGRWTCALVTTDGSAGGITYAVRSHGRCWNGSRLTDGGIAGLPPTISGCIGPLDQLRLDDHIGGGHPKPGFF